MAATIGRLGSVAVALALVVAGCDDPPVENPIPPKPVPVPGPAVPGAVGGGPGARGQLTERPHIEDRVNCPIPEQPSDPRDGKCDPKAPSCGEHLYCLQLAQGHYCEPCPERDGIRHAFKERDFDTEHNRDPFQSQLLDPPPPPTLTDGPKRCPRGDQLVAPSSSYVELKLVGIVAQGTRRKALMMAGPLGWILKRGDCVGKERAVVKDIGTGYITFQLDPDGSAANQRAPEEYSVQLNPKQLTMNEAPPPGSTPRLRAAPAASPGAVPRPGALPAGSSPAVPAPGTAAPPVEAPPAAKKP